VNAVAPRPVTNREFTRTLAGVVGRPAWAPAPAFGLRLLVGEMADAVLLGSTRAIPKRLQTLGYKFGFEEVRGALLDVVKPGRGGGE
jgi:uncharacterized protein